MIRRQINYVFSAAVSIFIVTAVLLAACASHTGEELVQATKKGDTETVKRLLEAGVDVNTEDSKHHSSVLMWAAHEGHTDIMDLLIQNGASVDIRKPSGETALWFAAQKGHLEALKILAHHGADVNVIGWEGTTALEVARKNGHQEIIDYLREVGADG